MEEEGIYQTFLLTRNKAETCRQHKRAAMTVAKVIAKIEKENAEVTGEHKNVRANAAETMQGRLLAKTTQVLDSIVPDDLADGVYTDIEYDDNNNIVNKRMYGARGVEKATMVGIMVDKLAVNQKYTSELRGEEASGGLLIPQDRDALLNAISGKIESIEAFRINMKDTVPDLATRVEVAKVMKDEMDDPTVVSLDEFDNPA